MTTKTLHRGASPPGEDAGAPAFGWRDGLAALGGPAALGGCLGLKLGLGATLSMAGLLPLALLGVGAATLPGLYVASALLGFAPRAHQIGRVALGATRDLGVVMLGLTPPLVLLVASLPSTDEALVLGMGAVMISALIGARAFFQRLDGAVDDVRCCCSSPSGCCWPPASGGSSS